MTSESIVGPPALLFDARVVNIEIDNEDGDESERGYSRHQACEE